jgi:Cdc6-like AAA superfamily ATPase
MVRKSRSPRQQFPSDFNIGNDVAESDPLLESAFYSSRVYLTIESRQSPHCIFLVGRTGSGKSAALKHLEENHSAHVVRIIPENLSLPYISNLDVLQKLEQAKVNPDPFFNALWKHVLLVELIQHRYGVSSPQVKQNVFDTLRAKVSGNNKKKHALEYFDEFAGKFWQETDERVKDIVDHFESEIQISMGTNIPFPGLAGVGPNASYGRTTGKEVHSEQADKYQRIVNQAQIARLNEMIRVLDEDILESDQHFTYVIVDDLDKDWVDSRIANNLLRCLFRAVWDFQQMKHLKIVVALRTNLFDQLDFGSSIGGQEEKYRALTHFMKWTPNELEELANERAKAAGELWKVPGGLASIRSVLPRTGKRRGDPFKYMLDRTLMRPRDLISFINECLAISSGSVVTWEVIQLAEPIYSKKRLSALRDEWKTTFPGIDQVFEIFRRAADRISQEQMMEKLIEAGTLLESPSFSGVIWLTGLTEGMWSGGGATWSEQYQPLIRLLYEIGFIGCIPAGQKKPTFAYDLPEFAESSMNLEQSESFVVHLAFCPALDIAGTNPVVENTSEDS